MRKLNIKLAPSFVVVNYLIFGHLLIMGLIFFSLDLLKFKLLLWSLLLISLYYTVYQFHPKKSKTAANQLLLQEEDQWQLVFLSGQRQNVILDSASLISAELIILNFKRAGNWRWAHVIITKRHTDPESLRQLRYYIRQTGTQK